MKEKKEKVENRHIKENGASDLCDVDSLFMMQYRIKTDTDIVLSASKIDFYRSEDNRSEDNRSEDNRSEDKKAVDKKIRLMRAVQPLNNILSDGYGGQVPPCRPFAMILLN